MKIKNMEGFRAGRLTGVEFAGTKDNRAWWLFLCDCGGTVITRGVDVRRGKTKSCGCLHSEKCSENGKNNKTHGYSVGSTRKLYDVYRQMIERCENPENGDYKNYGGRGILVGKDFKNIHQFFLWSKFSGYKEGLTLERIDVNGNYTQGNCKWIKNELQSHNTRKVIRITFNGETRVISEWSKIVGISQHTLKMRFHLGWTPEKILTTVPIKGRNQFGVNS